MAEDDSEWVVESIVGYLGSPEWVVPVTDFMENKCTGKNAFHPGLLGDASVEAERPVSAAAKLSYCFVGVVVGVFFRTFVAFRLFLATKPLGISLNARPFESVSNNSVKVPLS